MESLSGTTGPLRTATGVGQEPAPFSWEGEARAMFAKLKALRARQAQKAVNLDTAYLA